MQAIVATAENGVQVDKKVRVGLIGMHIAHKSKTSPQWIWATFEQVDNLDVDSVSHPKLRPSLFNPDCPTCVPNQQPSKKTDGEWIPSPKTQAWRAIPIPGDKRTLNAQAQAVLAKIGSPLQYYELIDTQWPTEPKAPPTPWTAGLPGAINNKTGGNPDTRLPHQHRLGDLLSERGSGGLPSGGIAERRSLPSDAMDRQSPRRARRRHDAGVWDRELHGLPLFGRLSYRSRENIGSVDRRLLLAVRDEGEMIGGARRR